MASFTVTRYVDAPRERVFAVFSDLRQADQWVEGIKQLEIIGDGPVGIGTRFREVREFYGREVSEDIEITGFEPPRRYVTECFSHGTHYTSEFRFEPQREGTEVTVTFQARPVAFWARLLSLFSGPMMRQARRCTEDDVLNLKDIAESTAAAHDPHHPAP